MFLSTTPLWTKQKLRTTEIDTNNCLGIQKSIIPFSGQPTKGIKMALVVKKKEKIETGTLYVRGVTKENLKFLNSEYVRLGYDSLGSYINELSRALRQEIIDAGGNPVRYKPRQGTEDAS